MEYNSVIKKLEKKELLSYADIKNVVDSYVKEIISDEKMAVFLKLICKNGLSMRETIDLTDVMVKSGKIINLEKVERNTVDKHSTGGIGDKVSLILGPIVASTGLAMPKMSGKGLGITGGTIDKLQSIPGYNVNLTEKEFFDMLNEVGISIISQSTNIVPADKKIYNLRNATGMVDNISLIASSIMSKKIATSADVIVIDLKVGKGAFMKNIKDATNLSKIMIKIAQAYNRKLVCVLTDMNEPLGYNVGNALEVQEVIEYFDGLREPRLEKVVNTIATYMVSYGKMISFVQAKKEVKKVIDEGIAKNVFFEWIKRQGGDLDKFIIKANKKQIFSKQEGYIHSIDALKIGKLVKDLGAGRKNKNDKIDYNVGIVLNKTVGSKVKDKELLATVYYNKELNNIEEKILEAFDIKQIKKISKNVILKVIK